MGRWAEKYSPEQRRAVVAAVLDHDLHATQAVELAAKDGLEGLPAFDFNIHYARELVRKERRRRQGIELTPLARQPPVKAFETLLRRLLALLERSIERAEQKDGEPDLDKLIKASKAADAVYGLLAKVTGGSKSRPSRPSGPSPKPEELKGSTDSAVLRAMEQDQEAPSSTNGANTTGQGVEPATEQDASAEEGQEDRVEAFSHSRTAHEHEPMPTALQPE